MKKLNITNEGLVEIQSDALLKAISGGVQPQPEVGLIGHVINIYKCNSQLDEPNIGVIDTIDNNANNIGTLR